MARIDPNGDPVDGSPDDPLAAGTGKGAWSRASRDRMVVLLPGMADVPVPQSEAARGAPSAARAELRGTRGGPRVRDAALRVYVGERRTTTLRATLSGADLPLGGTRTGMVRAAMGGDVRARGARIRRQAGREDRPNRVLPGPATGLLVARAAHEATFRIGGAAPHTRASVHAVAGRDATKGPRGVLAHVAVEPAARVRARKARRLGMALPGVSGRAGTREGAKVRHVDRARPGVTVRAGTGADVRPRKEAPSGARGVTTDRRVTEARPGAVGETATIVAAVGSVMVAVRAGTAPARTAARDRTGTGGQAGPTAAVVATRTARGPRRSTRTSRRRCSTERPAGDCAPCRRPTPTTWRTTS